MCWNGVLCEHFLGIKMQQFEINVWAHFYKISLVFKGPSLPWGQRDARKKLKLSKVGINMVKLVDSVSAFEYMLVFLSKMLINQWIVIKRSFDGTRFASQSTKILGGGDYSPCPPISTGPVAYASYTPAWQFISLVKQPNYRIMKLIL